MRIVVALLHLLRALFCVCVFFLPLSTAERVSVRNHYHKFIKQMNKDINLFALCRVAKSVWNTFLSRFWSLWKSWFLTGVFSELLLLALVLVLLFHFFFLMRYFLWFKRNLDQIRNEQKKWVIFNRAEALSVRATRSICFRLLIYL